VAEWPAAIHRVMERYPNALYIIPGHFGWGDPQSLSNRTPPKKIVRYGNWSKIMKTPGISMTPKASQKIPGVTFEFKRTLVLIKRAGSWKILAGQNAKLEKGIK
jgi:hypothetical protein